MVHALFTCDGCEETKFDGVKAFDSLEVCEGVDGLEAFVFWRDMLLVVVVEDGVGAAKEFNEVEGEDGEGAS